MERPTPHSTKHAPRSSGLRIASFCLALVLSLAPLACGGDLQSRLAEIQALQDAGEWEASIEPLRELLSNNSSHPEINYRLGVAMMQTGRRSLAVWPLQKASQSDEYAVQAGLLLATTLLSTEDNEEAIRAAERVLAIDPENTSALYAHAHANIANHDAEAALADAERILQILPGDARATTLRLGALVDLERFDEATEIHRELIQITEESGDADRAARACGSFGTFQVQRNQLAEAETTYRDCLQKYPDSAPVRTWLSDFYVNANRIDDAATLWQEAIDERPEDPQLRVRLAKLLEDGGQPARAGKLYEESVDLFDTLQAWKQLAEFRRRTGNLAGAREAIEKAIERAPSGAAALRYELADLMVLDGELDAARKLASELDEPAYRDLLEGRIKLAENDPKGAIQSFEVGLRKWPNNANARYLTAIAAEQIGDMERAKAEYREAVRADEKATDASLRLAQIYFDEASYEPAMAFALRHLEARPTTSPAAHVIAARSSVALGNAAAAETQLNDLLRYERFAPVAWTELASTARAKLGAKAAIDIAEQSGLDATDPENRNLLEGLVGDYVKLGQADRALALIDQAGKRSNADELTELRARTLASVGRGDEARKLFDELVARNDENSSALEGLGTLALGQRDPEGALAFFDKAVAADEGNADAHYGAAHALLASGRKVDALQRFRDALGATPSHAGAANDLAWLLAEAGEELDEALELAKRAVQVDSTANTLDTLGFVQLKRGQNANAEKLFRTALDEYGGSPSIRYRLGLALAATGKPEEAAAEFERALQGGPFPEAAEARRRLAEYGK